MGSMLAGARRRRGVDHHPSGRRRDLRRGLVHGGRAGHRGSPGKRTISWDSPQRRGASGRARRGAPMPLNNFVTFGSTLPSSKSTNCSRALCQGIHEVVMQTMHSRRGGAHGAEVQSDQQSWRGVQRARFTQLGRTTMLHGTGGGAHDTAKGGGKPVQKGRYRERRGGMGEQQHTPQSPSDVRS